MFFKIKVYRITNYFFVFHKLFIQTKESKNNPAHKNIFSKLSFSCQSTFTIFD